MNKADSIVSWVLEYPFVKKDYKEEWDAFRFLLGEKMFGMIAYNKIGTPILTLKLPPQEGAFYREQFSYITEGYYMNKVHWISIAYEEAQDIVIKDLIEKSYTAFYEGLPAKTRKALEGN